MSFLLKQSTAFELPVFMVDSADHITGKTGLTLTITAGKAGGALASISPTVTERSNGWYTLSLTTSHTDTLGALVLHITSTGADTTDMTAQVIAVDLGDSVRLGLTALPNAAAAAADGLIVAGTGTNAISLSGGQVTANVAAWAGTAVPSGVSNGRPYVDVATITDGTVTNNISAWGALGIARKDLATAGGASTITLDASASATDDFYNGLLVHIFSGTGVGQTRRIRDYAGATKVATVAPPWTITPDGTSEFVVLGDAGSEDVNVTEWLGDAVDANAAGIPLVDLSLWLSSSPNALDNGDVPANVNQWLGTAVAAPTVAGIPKVEVSSFVAAAITSAAFATSALEAIRDKILDYPYRTGRTVRGLFRRVGASLEKASGLLGSTATFFQPDGVTEEFHVTQDVANGTRTNPVVTNSEVP